MSFPSNFFKALNSNERDDAVDTIKRSAFGTDSKPSPKAQELINSGEWDQDQKLSLVFVDSTCCYGRVGKDSYRFCGKKKALCTVAGHFTNTVDGVSAGWYIANLGKNSGVFTQPYLPDEPDGPIDSTGAALLLDGEAPFRLTRGQWRYVMDAWHAGRVETIDDTDSSEVEKRATGEESPKMEHPLADLTFMLDKLRVDTHNEERLEVGDIGNKAEPKQDDSDDSEDEDDYDPAELKEELRALRHRVQIHEIDTIETAAKHEEAIKALAEASEQEIVKARERIRALEQTADAQRQQLQDFKETVTNALQLLANQNGTPQSHNNGMTDAEKAILVRVEHEVLNPLGTLETLRSRFTEFRDKQDSGGGITCHNVTFNSKTQLLAWFKEKHQHIDYFLDALAYLHAIRPAVVHIEDATRQREREGKLNLGSALQTAVETSFDTIIPSVLLGGRTVSEQGGSVYGWLISHLKKFEVWKPLAVEDGVANQITDGVALVTDRITELRYEKTEESSAIVLSTGLCADSANFCRELVRFITNQYEELTQRTLYTPQQIWSMQMECLSTIINELCAARGSVVDAARKQPAYYLWGMLRAWKVQSRYLANKFKDDPALTGIMVRRILMQGQDTSLRNKLEEITSIKQKVDENQRKHDEQHRNVLGELRKIKDNTPKK